MSTGQRKAFDNMTVGKLRSLHLAHECLKEDYQRLSVLLQRCYVMLRAAPEEREQLRREIGSQVGWTE